MVRGEIYWTRFPRHRGREHAGERYGVIVQADEFLGLSTAIVVPTSRSAVPATFRPEIEIDGVGTRVLVEQIRAVEIGRIGKLAGRLSIPEQRAVDDALGLVLGLA